MPPRRFSANRGGAAGAPSPRGRAAGSKPALEEERRLFYVGLTRARSRLFLSYARSRFLSYLSTSRVPSRFLSEIPEDVLQTSVPASSARPWTSAPAPKNSFRPGAIVSHKTFGEGRVLAATGAGRGRKRTGPVFQGGRREV